MLDAHSAERSITTENHDGDFGKIVSNEVKLSGSFQTFILAHFQVDQTSSEDPTGEKATTWLLGDLYKYLSPKVFNI